MRNHIVKTRIVNGLRLFIKHSVAKADDAKPVDRIDCGKNKPDKNIARNIRIKKLFEIHDHRSDCEKSNNQNDEKNKVTFLRSAGSVHTLLIHA